MKRRKFLQVAGLSSTTFLISLGARGSDLPEIPLVSLLNDTLINLALGILVQNTFSSAENTWGRRSVAWHKNRLVSLIAQSKFIEYRFVSFFSDMLVAEVQSSQYSYIFASHFREHLGYIPAFCFIQMRGSQPSISSFSGPSCIGMAFAAKYLREQEGLSIQDVQNAILPIGQDYDQWQTWSQYNSCITYQTVVSQNGVSIEYRAVSEGRGGLGMITVIVNAHRQIQTSVIVQYA